MVVKKPAHCFHILFYHSAVAIRNSVNNLGTSVWLEVCVTFSLFFPLSDERVASAQWPPPVAGGTCCWLYSQMPLPLESYHLHIFLHCPSFQLNLLFKKPLFFCLVIFLFMKNDCLLFDSSLGIFTHLSLEQGSHFLVSTWFGWHHRVIINLWVSWKCFKDNLKQNQIQKPAQTIQMKYLPK